jgi:hypothetical protein
MLLQERNKVGEVALLQVQTDYFKIKLNKRGLNERNEECDLKPRTKTKPSLKSLV